MTEQLMTEQQNIELKLKLNLLIDIWRSFCEMHTNLYEYTCDEYMHLYKNNIIAYNLYPFYCFTKKITFKR